LPLRNVGARRLPVGPSNDLSKVSESGGSFFMLNRMIRLPLQT